MEDSRTDPISYELTIRAGGRDDRNEKYGLAHFVEHVISNVIEASTQSHEWLSNYIGNTFEARTHQDKTTYFLRTASDDQAIGTQLVVLPLIVEKLENFLTPLVIEQERAVVQKEFADSLDEEDATARRFIAKSLYPSSTLSRADVLGTIDKIALFSLKDVLDFIKKYYTVENSFLTIAGGYNIEDGSAQLIEILKDAASQNSDQEIDRQVIQQIIYKPLNTVIFQEHTSHQNILMLVRLLPKSSLKQSIQLSILQGMLGQYLEYFARKEGHAYEITVKSTAHRDHFKFSVQMSASPAKSVELVKWLKAAIRTFYVELNDEVVDVYKRNLVKSIRVDSANLDSVLDTNSWYMFHYRETMTLEHECSLITAVSKSELLGLLSDIFFTEQVLTIILGQMSNELNQMLQSAPQAG